MCSRFIASVSSTKTTIIWLQYSYSFVMRSTEIKFYLLYKSPTRPILVSWSPAFLLYQLNHINQVKHYLCKTVVYGCLVPELMVSTTAWLFCQYTDVEILLDPHQYDGILPLHLWRQHADLCLLLRWLVNGHI